MTKGGLILKAIELTAEGVNSALRTRSPPRSKALSKTSCRPKTSDLGTLVISQLLTEQQKNNKSTSANSGDDQK